jgi:hypothetical protein
MRYILRKSLIWGTVGFGIAAFFSILAPVVINTRLRILLFPMPILWPASFGFMATDNASRGALVMDNVLFCLVNFVTYFILGMLVTSLWKVARIMLNRHPVS